MIEISAGTVVVFADLLCPFAHVAVHRLWTTRSRLGLDDAVVLPDGTSHVNPGVEVRWQGVWARGFPVIEGDDPGVYEHILKTAAQPVRAGT
jgi:hypothetical protein